MTHNNTEAILDYLDLSKYTRYRIIRFAPEIELIGELVERALGKPINDVFGIMEILVYNLHDSELTEMDIKQYFHDNDKDLDETTLEELLILSEELSEMFVINSFDGSLYMDILIARNLMKGAERYATIDDLKYINGCYEIYYSLFIDNGNSLSLEDTVK